MEIYNASPTGPIRSAALIAAVACVAAAGWLPSDARAQAGNEQTAQQASNSADANDVGALQEVVVTAEKRSTNIQTTPISMEAVSNDTLQSENQMAVIDLPTVTPGLQVANIGFYAAPTIRGIGNDQFSASEIPGVALIKDGLFVQGIHDTDDPFFDMADVEVLKGPQGDFIGFSSTGGAILVNSANPNFNGTSGFIEVQAGNYTDKKVDGAVNFQFSSTLAARIAFNFEQMHSFYRDIGSLVDPGEAPGSAIPIQDPGATDNKDIRLSLLWKPNDDFQALAKIEYNSIDTGALSGEPNQATFTLPPAAVAAGCPDAIAPGGTTPAGPGGTCHAAYYPYSTHLPYVINYGYGLMPAQAYERLPALDEAFWDYRDSLVLTYTLPDKIQIRSETGFQQGAWNDLSQSCSCGDAQSGVGYEYVPHDNYYSQEFNVLSPTTGRLTWVGGATLWVRTSPVTNESITSTPPYTLAAPQITLSDTYVVQRMMGVFGRVSWKFSDAWQADFGLRDNWDNNFTRGPINEVQLPGLATPCTEAPAVLPGYGCRLLPLNGAFKDTVPTGKVTLNWNPAPGQFFYLFYARGYTPGGYIAGTSKPYQPEHVGDYELGWKPVFFNGRLQGSLGGYWMNYQGMQQTVYDTSTGTSTTGNLGSSKLRGIETSWNLREGGFGLDFDAGLEKSSLGSITAPATYALPPAAANKPQCTGPGGTVVGAGQTGCFNYQPYELSLSGEENPFAPEFSSTTTVDYRIPLSGGTLDPKLQFTFTGKQYGSIYQIPYYAMGARHLWNAYLTYDKGHSETEFYITNFTHQVYINGNFGGSNIYYGNPMQLGMRFRWSY